MYKSHRVLAIAVVAINLEILCGIEKDSVSETGDKEWDRRMSRAATTVEMINLQIHDFIVVSQRIKLQTETIDLLVWFGGNMNDNAMVGRNQKSNLTVKKRERLLGK